jgi:hypothetical protein
MGSVVILFVCLINIIRERVLCSELNGVVITDDSEIDLVWPKHFYSRLFDSIGM